MAKKSASTPKTPRAAASGEPTPEATEKKTKSAPKAAAKKASASAKPAAKKAAARPAAAAPAEPKPARKAAARKSVAKTTAKPSAPAESVGAPVATGRLVPPSKRPASVPTAAAPIAWRTFAMPDPPAPEDEIPALPELPSEYGRTRVAVLVKDAEWAYVYWEIAAPTRAEFGLDREGSRHSLMLRVYDVTGVVFNGSNHHSRSDFPVTDLVNCWYVRVPQQGRTYLVDLGVIGPRGQFTTLVRSNPFTMPHARLSEDIDWSWSPELAESHLQILRMSGGYGGSSHLSSAEFITDFHQRLAETVSSMNAGGFSADLIGSEFMTRALQAREQAMARDRSFWLVVDAEVIVYGATDPDARVKLMGRPIRLNTDGTFGVRMALPNGTLEFPIEAVSPDGEEVRSVMPIVNRRTVEAPTG